MGLALAVCIGDELEASSLNSSAAAIYRAVEQTLPAAEVAQLIGVPPEIGVSYRIEGEVSPQARVVHVDFSVRRAEEVADLLAAELDGEIGDLVLRRLNGLTVASLGAPHQDLSLKLVVVDAEPRLVSSAKLAERAGFAPDRVLGWSKGCNSWPW